MKIFCIGRNYVDHAKELNNPLPTEPVVFSKPNSAMLINGKPFYYPDFSKDIHFEGELIIQICRNGKNIQEKFAHKYFNKVGFGIDFTARDIQQRLKEKGLPWEIAKGFNGAAVIGDLIDIEDLPDVNNIEFFTRKNGEVVQHGRSADMIFSFGKIIEYLSKYFLIQTGDLIFTGTPAGVGPVEIGDKLEGYIGDRRLLQCKIK